MNCENSLYRDTDEIEKMQNRLYKFGAKIRTNLENVRIVRIRSERCMILTSNIFNRKYIIDSICTQIQSEDPDEQIFKLTGICGADINTTLTSIKQVILKNKDWIVIELYSDSDMIMELVSELYYSISMITDYVDVNLNLSRFRIGKNVLKKSPIASISYALEVLIREIKKNGKRLLIIIDKAHMTKGMIDFIQEFQMLIREELPIFVVMAGSVKDVDILENTDGITFLLRATKYEMISL